MSLFSLPARYMRVKWARTLILLGIFVLGVASMTALDEVSRTVGESFEKKLVSYGANILVVPRRDTLKVSYGGYTLGDVTLEQHSLPLDDALAAIDGIEYRANLAVIAPKLLAVTHVPAPESGVGGASGDQTVGVVGVIWDEELAIKSYWDVEGQWPQEYAAMHGGGESVLAGSKAAERLGLTVENDDGSSANGGTASVVPVAGEPLPVAGILHETGGDDDNVLFVSLPLLQRLTGRPGQADFLEVAALCSGCPIDDIVQNLKTALPGEDVLALRQVAESRMYSVHFAQKLTFYVSLVILITACATVFMAMLSAVNERRREIGIMRSVGFSRADVFAVFALEALAIGVVSGVVGFLLGHWLADYVLANLHLLDDAATAATGGGFGWLYFGLTVAAVGGIAVVAALFPAWKASRVEPTEALALA